MRKDFKAVLRKVDGFRALVSCGCVIHSRIFYSGMALTLPDSLIRDACELVKYMAANVNHVPNFPHLSIYSSSYVVILTFNPLCKRSVCYQLIVSSDNVTVALYYHDVGSPNYRKSFSITPSGFDGVKNYIAERFKIV